MNLVVSAAALGDVERLRTFLRDEAPRAARRAVFVLDAAIGSLPDAPERGRPTDLPGVRELIVPFGRSAYVIRYLYSRTRDEIVVLRIWHGREARDP